MFRVWVIFVCRLLCVELRKTSVYEGRRIEEYKRQLRDKHKQMGMKEKEGDGWDRWVVVVVVHGQDGIDLGGLAFDVVLRAPLLYSVFVPAGQRRCCCVAE